MKPIGLVPTDRQLGNLYVVVLLLRKLAISTISVLVGRKVPSVTFYFFSNKYVGQMSLLISLMSPTLSLWPFGPFAPFCRFAIYRHFAKSGRGLEMQKNLSIVFKGAMRMPLMRAAK